MRKRRKKEREGEGEGEGGEEGVGDECGRVHTGVMFLEHQPFDSDRTMRRRVDMQRYGASSSNDASSRMGSPLHCQWII